MSLLAPARRVGAAFQNPVPTTPGLKSPLRAITKLLTNRAERTPRTPLGPFVSDPAVYVAPPASGLRITWLGHSTALIEIDGVRLLTDPVWGPRASFSRYLGPRRFYPPPLAFADLPPLDAVLLSHDHYDHLDAITIRRFAALEVPFITSLGVGGELQRLGISPARITELDWMESTALGAVSIMALPARHFSGRTLVRDRTLWSAFALRGPRHNVFYGADSGPFPGFAEIGERFGPFDLTMLEIGAADENWPDIHLGPDGAAAAHIALRGRLMLPIHWGLFNLAFHAWNQPIERLVEIAPGKGINLWLPRPGLAAEPCAALNTEWWRRRA